MWKFFRIVMYMQNNFRITRLKHLGICAKLSTKPSTVSKLIIPYPPESAIPRASLMALQKRGQRKRSGSHHNTFILTHDGEEEMSKRPKKLLDQVRDTIRRKHYSIRTEEAYIRWIKRYILYHGKRHPKDMGIPEIEAFLTYLAVEQHVAASTQNQALSALLFLYREVLKKDLERPIDSVRATCTATVVRDQSGCPRS
jgi:tryptophanyl-tRNA synthetase